MATRDEPPAPAARAGGGLSDGIGRRRAALALGAAFVAVCLLMLVPAWIAAAVAGTSVPAVERQVLLWFQRLPEGWLQRVAREVGNLSEGVTMAALAVSGALLVWERDRPAALVLLATYVGGVLIDYVVKFTIQRSRPEFIEWPERTASASSYPSGHAFEGIAFYLVLAWVITRAAPPGSAGAVWSAAVLVGLASGFNRLYLGVHWPSDVLAGWVAGAAWAGACIAVGRRMRGEASAT